jgi:hypothetical protein
VATAASSIGHKQPHDLITTLSRPDDRRDGW